MSSFAPLTKTIDRYRALRFHHDPQLAARLSAIQVWQKKRMHRLHAELFAVPENHLMTEYFFNQLYGGPNFDVLAEQCERLVKAAKVFEGIIPASALNTALKSTELAVLAIELDLQLAEHMDRDLLDDQQNPAINDAYVAQLYRTASQAQGRYLQLDLLDELGANLDKYIRSKVIYRIFKLSKGLMMRYGLDVIYAFNEEGFTAMRPMRSTKSFISEFTQGERDVIARIYAGNNDPFARGYAQVVAS
jgi:hypothetical protein